MSKQLLLTSGLVVVSLYSLFTMGGCVSLKAPENVHIANRNEPRRVDSRRVPLTSSHEDARQKLAEAYERNRYLEDKVQRLERDKRELKDELDDLKDKYDD